LLENLGALVDAWVHQLCEVFNNHLISNTPQPYHTLPKGDSISCSGDSCEAQAGGVSSLHLKEGAAP
jgi:hypothetical protein